MPPDTAAPPHPIEIDEAALRRWPLPMPGDGGKEERGVVVIVGGTREVPGAVVLAATAALRAGAGKVTIATPASVATSVALAVPESRVIALGETAAGGIAADAESALRELADKADSVLIGPGLLNDEATWEMTAALLSLFSETAIVLDAGAMGVCGSARGLAMRLPRPVLLTPHAGEMASLTGARKEAVEASPRTAALEAAGAWNAVVALKGAVTHIAAPDGRTWRHEGGNAGLGTAGSGDVLGGIISGLMARGAALEQACAWGVALHALAGVRLAGRCGTLGYLAREIPGEVPPLMDAWSPKG
jgi:ADP-dependent NAD(P)H-hydrate dehydratase